LVWKKFRPACVLFILLTCVTVCWPQSVRHSRLKIDTIEERLRRYEGNDAERGNTLHRLFESAGCKNEYLQVQPVDNDDAPNVICILPGETEEVIVVGAHFDRVDIGDGVADNWSGASLLPSLYQSLSSTMRKHTFVFIGFTKEEEGFFGSRFYVDQLSEEELASIMIMINLDTLGLDSTRVWTSKSDPDLVGLLNRVAEEMQLPLNTLDVDDLGNSDGSSFRRRSIPTLTLHSVTLDNLHVLHSEEDKYSAIRIDDYYETYSLVAAYLAILDQRELRLMSPVHDGKKKSE
jgi:hypothetical protein